MSEHTDAKPRSVLAGLAFAAASFGAGALGALTMRGKGSPDGAWFAGLKKPAWQPPNWLFAPVWSALYAMIAYSGYRIWQAPKSRARTRALSLWGAQMVLNGAWTPLFFGARRPLIALADIGLLDATATAYAAAARAVDPKAASLVVPYLGWLGYATSLNGSIVTNN